MEKMPFGAGFKFSKDDLPPSKTTDRWGGAKSGAFSFGAASMDFDDSSWTSVDIPHDFVIGNMFERVDQRFSVEGIIPAMDDIANRLAAGGSLSGGPAWYRKTFSLDCEGKRAFLFFDGIQRDCDVYLNHFHVGRHESGSSSFHFDITDFMNPTSKNVLCIRVDASGREGWWYEGGGIYRNVWIAFASQVFIEPDSAYARFENGCVALSFGVLSKAPCEVSVFASVIDANGILRASAKAGIAPSPFCETKLEIPLPDARLWSLEDPHLYKIRIELESEGAILDETEIFFGARTIRFDKDCGFFLNGKSVKLKGVCCHEDHSGLGIAIDRDVICFRLKKLQEMGCNAYRCSHNPPSPELLDACDRLGMLVLDETRLFSISESSMEELGRMVKRDRNHPCVFMWSLGNEEIFVQQHPNGRQIAQAMKSEANRLDGSRPVTLAIVFWNGQNMFDDVASVLPVSTALDVMGFNYGHEHWDAYRKLSPDQPAIVTEASSSRRTRGCYETIPELCQLSGIDAGKLDPSSEEQWKRVAEDPYASGIFVWTGFDYKGEPGPFSWPAVGSQFGILDSCGFPKDNFYYYKSWWQDEPVLHIFPHWNWPGKEGLPIDVMCFSNCETVELFLNGQSLGRKSMPANGHLSWTDVIYQPGELMASGCRKGKEIRHFVFTTEAPFRLELSPSLDGFGQTQTIILSAKVLDRLGRVVPYADPLIRFKTEGHISLIGTGNGDPACHDPDKSSCRRAFCGLAQVLAKNDGGGKVVAEANGLFPAEFIIGKKAES
ncbi:MAG: DUF4982 domain-containing protein [Clostridiales bacterium]|jgi:beta-galactosidase|nr:DUF4982 domain-containing protein [Clostridiales bacterium]